MIDQIRENLLSCHSLRMTLDAFLANLFDKRENLPTSNPSDYAIGTLRIGNDRKLYKIWRLFSNNCTIITIKCF
jgi:hypothetical protein